MVKRKYCSKGCSNKSRNKYFKGKGKTIHNGYVMIYKPDHPFAGSNGYLKEHRWIFEQHIGRFLGVNELIHHKNGNKLDNRIENLKLTTRKDHLMKEHKHVRDNKGRFFKWTL